MTSFKQPQPVTTLVQSSSGTKSLPPPPSSMLPTLPPKSCWANAPAVLWSLLTGHANIEWYTNSWPSSISIGSWSQLASSCPPFSITPASLSSAGSATLPAASVTARGLSYACKQSGRIGVGGEGGGVQQGTAAATLCCAKITSGSSTNKAALFLTLLQVHKLQHAAPLSAGVLASTSRCAHEYWSGGHAGWTGSNQHPVSQRPHT